MWQNPFTWRQNLFLAIFPIQYTNLVLNRSINIMMLLMFRHERNSILTLIKSNCRDFVGNKKSYKCLFFAQFALCISIAIEKIFFAHVWQKNVNYGDLYGWLSLVLALFSWQSFCSIVLCTCFLLPYKQALHF